MGRFRGGKTGTGQLQSVGRLDSFGLLIRGLEPFFGTGAGHLPVELLRLLILRHIGHIGHVAVGPAHTTVFGAYQRIIKEVIAGKPQAADQQHHHR